MKIDAQITTVEPLLQAAKSVLILLPAEASIDALSAGLSLYLALNQSGKETAIATEGVIKVGHTSLFGVGQIQNAIPQAQGGNFVISLGGVVKTENGQPVVPALQELKWHPEGENLNLVFYPVPGQKFEPISVTPKYEGGNFDLVFIIGASKLENLGSLYTSNQDLFTQVQTVNIDNHSDNSQFGKVNLVDSQSASLSEMVGLLIPSLKLTLDGDTATNILAGIFSATNNLQVENLTADTYEAVAQALRAGGQKPKGEVMEGAQPQPEPQKQPEEPGQGFDLSKILQMPAQVEPAPVGSGPVESYTVPPVVTEQQSSPEEKPAGEGVQSAESEEVVQPEDDWLTPKIYKGGSVG